MGSRKYTDEDVRRILEACSDGDTPGALQEKCRKALEYRWYRFGLRKEEKKFLMHKIGYIPCRETGVKQAAGQ